VKDFQELKRLSDLKFIQQNYYIGVYTRHTVHTYIQKYTMLQNIQTILLPVLHWKAASRI